MSPLFLKQSVYRLMALLLCALLLLPCIPAARAEGENGSCGDNLSWSLSAGVLTISGSGAMTDYSESTMAPWYPLREEIVQLVLPAGLTKIGSLAFYECSNLITLTIPDSVEGIGEFAFTGCEKLEYMSMGNRVRTIGQYAFSECSSLKALHLPGSLVTIGDKAFYRCESIPGVIVPENVTHLGMLVFGYCRSLVSADIRANIQRIPEFLFYECNLLTSVSFPDNITDMGSYVFEGCERLNTVYYSGDSYSAEQIEDTVNKSVPQFGTTGTVTDSDPVGFTKTETSNADNSGNVTQEIITVVQGENNTITSKVEKTDDNTDVSFSVIINNNEDWESAEILINSTLNETENVDNINIDIYVEDSSQIDSDFIKQMTDKGATINVITQNGSSWKLDSESQNGEAEVENYDLRYTVLDGSDELSTALGAEKSFVIQFHSDAEVNAEVIILLGSTWAGRQATLFQHNDEDGVSVIQSVIVDRMGYAHFFLNKVSADTEYCIGMDVLSERNNAIIPEEMLSDYGNAENYQPVEYEITGRTSSWGMNLGQVMGILAVVMVTVIVVVGAVMFFWNKQRLKNGYVPQWDDEEE